MSGCDGCAVSSGFFLIVSFAHVIICANDQKMVLNFER